MRDLLLGIEEFKRECHELFGVFDSSKSRIVNLEHTYSSLSGLSIDQDDLFRQSIRCAETQVFRAAHVMAWAATADYLESYCASDGFVAINSARTKWKIIDKDDLKDRFTEYSIIEAMKEAHLIKKNEMKALHGMLSKRNECAHPSNYFPDYNQTLGYISELISRIRVIQIRRGIISE